jgi:hypothetical protein
MPSDKGLKLPTPGRATDYRELLKKYMRFLVNVNGSDSLDHPRDEELFSVDEWEELRAVREA